MGSTNVYLSSVSPSNPYRRIYPHINRESRMPPLLPLSLTVSGFPLHPSVPKTSPNAASKLAPNPTLSHALNIILLSTTTLPLSLSLLNSKSFFPISKEEDLHAGRLQLPTGTTVVITDNAMTEGRVSETGNHWLTLAL